VRVDIKMDCIALFVKNTDDFWIMKTEEEQYFWPFVYMWLGTCS
jgi:hypothetical protein